REPHRPRPAARPGDGRQPHRQRAELAPRRRRPLHAAPAQAGAGVQPPRLFHVQPLAVRPRPGAEEGAAGTQAEVSAGPLSDASLDEAAAIRGKLVSMAGNAVGFSRCWRNMRKVDMGESQVMQDSVDRLRLNAIKCRDLASTAVTSAAREIFDGLAQQYEQKATRLERS